MTGGLVLSLYGAFAMLVLVGPVLDVNGRFRVVSGGEVEEYTLVVGHLCFS